MFERPKVGQRAILVHVELPGSDYDSDHAEFIELARSAGADILAIVTGSRRSPEAGLFVGRGKVEEIAAAVQQHEAELVLFNHDLSPSQERNLERELKARVVGRSGLILDIFATRARSHEGKLQVELAQLQHMSTRLVRGWTHLERQKGGIGMRGPGESQLETDRRLVRDRIAALKRRIEEVRQRRARSRRSRERRQVPTVSLVGYTNAGKSTLFNALTADSTFASSQLFATLDTTLRQLSLPFGEPVVLADTVGFIRDLPHDLIAAFRATLEEAREADLLMHVIDAADPERMTRIEQVRAVLDEIGAAEVPRLEVFNKIDLRASEQARIERDETGTARRVYVSAVSGQGLDLLRSAIAEYLQAQQGEHLLVLPPQAARLRAALFAQRAVVDETVDEDGQSHLRVILPAQRLRELCAEAGVPLPEGLDATDSG